MFDITSMLSDETTVQQFLTAFVLVILMGWNLFLARTLANQIKKKNTIS